MSHENTNRIWITPKTHRWCGDACRLCHVATNADVGDVVVTDIIPDGAELVSPTPKHTREGNNLIWRFNAMDAGQVNTIRIKFKPVKVGDLRSCATVHALPRVCMVVMVGKPKLSITKTGPETAVIGNVLQYTVTVSNPGTMLARNVVVTDTIPVGLAHSSGDKELTWNIGDLAPKSQRTLTFTVKLKAVAKGIHCNKVVANSSNAGSVNAEACTKILQPGLKVSKSGPPLQFLGKAASYTIRVTNSGETTLHDVRVTDSAAAATTISSAAGASVSRQTAIWTIPTLDPGAAKTFNVVLTTMTPGTHPNSVSVSTREGLTGSDKVDTVWEGISALLITVEDSPDPILVGESTTYTIRVTNQGTADDSEIKLIANFGAENTPIAASDGGKIDGKTVTFNYPKLSPKQSFTYTITAKGESKGDHRLRVTRTLKDIPKPTNAEESTRVY